MCAFSAPQNVFSYLRIKQGRTPYECMKRVEVANWEGAVWRFNRTSLLLSCKCKKNNAPITVHHTKKQQRQNTCVTTTKAPQTEINTQQTIHWTRFLPVRHIKLLAGGQHDARQRWVVVLRDAGEEVVLDLHNTSNGGADGRRVEY